MGVNALSLFDGLSGGMITFESENVKVDNYFSSEIEESSIKISNFNYPYIKRLGDITKIDDFILSQLPKIDIILAGSPCQGFSRQGNCLNFEHTQSKLFFDFMRILNWIKENNNPEVKFMLENVKMKKEWEDVITKYVDVSPLDINSKLLSAQNRPRTYWTNIEGVEPPKDENITLKSILAKIDKSNFRFYQGILVDNTFTEKELSLIKVIRGEVRILQATKKGYIVANDGDGVNLSFPTSKTRRGRVINQKASTLDKVCNVCVYYDGILRKLTISELERLQTLPTGYTSCVTDNKRKEAIGNGWTINVIAHILSYANFDKKK